MRNAINSLFTLQEAEHALLATNSTKTPGPDEMNTEYLSLDGMSFGDITWNS